MLSRLATSHVAIPAVEDADIFSYRAIILLPFLEMEPEPLDLDVNETLQRRPFLQQIR
jgi:hypothetical protein